MAANSTDQRDLLNAFIAAGQDGDVAALEGLFASNVVPTTDGDGLVCAA